MFVLVNSLNDSANREHPLCQELETEKIIMDREKNILKSILYNTKCN